MSHVTFQFHTTLNHFLPNERQHTAFDHTFDGRVSIKDMIESFGVPHTEVDLIIINDRSVDFAYQVLDGDCIQVYPIGAVVPQLSVTRLQPDPLPEPRFVLDVHLGRLTSYLRMMGFDALFPENYDDEYLAEISSTENRILLSRDRGLLMRKIVMYGYYVRATNPRQQVIEVAQRYDLIQQLVPFRRCAHCNGIIEPVEKAAILDRIQPDTRLYYDEFRLCTGCNRVYWKGTHYERMQEFIAEIMRKCNTNGRG